MTIIIHPGKCDQAVECECPLVCTQKAWRRVNNRWTIDENKCNNCGICLKECPANALFLAKNKEEKVKITHKIKEDKVFPVDKLFIERYGSMPIKETLTFIDKIPKSSNIVIEIFDTNTIECLAHSIPYSDFLPKKYKIYKVHINQKIKNKFNIKITPSLIIMNKNDIIKKFEGYTNNLNTLTSLFK